MKYTIAKIFVNLRNNFFKWILVSAPIFITLYVAWILIKYFDNKVTPILGPIIPSSFNPSSYLPFEIPGIGLITVFIFFAAIGFLTTGFLGRIFSSFAERTLSRMPILRNIYNGLKQLFETLLAKKKDSFREVILLEYPRKGIWAMGFLTGHTEGEVQRRTKNSMINIFLPTTPNPTSGFLLFVPFKDVLRLNMTVEEGIKMIISAGMITPSENQKKLRLLRKKIKK